MADQKQDVITFGKQAIDPQKEAEYRAKLDRVRGTGVNALKGSTPLGTVERPNMPLLATQKGNQLGDISGLTAEGGVAPRPAGAPPVSNSTQQQLVAMQQAQQDQAKLDEEALKKDAEAAKEDLFEMFDFGGQSEAERILNNRKRRQEIEGRCEEMNIEDLILRDEVRQKVQIVPGKFEVVFRSLLPEESLFIKQYLSKEKSPNDAYALEKYSICQLTCALVSLNGKEFLDHRDPNGELNDRLFEQKLKSVLKKSGYIVGDLALNYAWFDIRVRKLLNPDLLGNG